MTARSESTYALGAVCRITGLSPHVLRVWERRYGAIDPLRTPKGTRRYRRADVERLQLLRAAVAAGYRIGTVVGLDDAALAALARASQTAVDSAGPKTRAIEAIERLDAVGAERVIADQLVALGPVRFAREFALPLLHAVGERWDEGKLCVAAEHMTSALLRSLLGAALRPSASSGGAPLILFATLPGERHEIGLMVSALVAMGAGASPLFLGAEMPAAELAKAAELSGARALALAQTQLSRTTARELAATRTALASDVEIWLGGAAASTVPRPAGVLLVASLDDLERHVVRLHEQAAIRTLAKPKTPALKQAHSDRRHR
jgi:DNA-binding transcriptional MerR regulator